MLLDRGMTKEALAAFEATKAKEPNRFQGYAGAAKAADRLGNKDAARQNYQQLVVLTANADTERPEVATAKTYLASN
jgi:Flp pilus assembly protein TadD